MPCLPAGIQTMHELNSHTAADLAEVGHEERADESEGSQSGVPRGKNKQDFVKKNIEVCQSSCWAKCSVRLSHDFRVSHYSCYSFFNGKYI